MDIGSWFAAHKVQVLGGAAVGGLGIVIYARRKASAGAAATAALQPSLIANTPSGFTAGIDPTTGLPYGYITPPGYVPGSGGAGGSTIGASPNPPSQAPGPAQQSAVAPGGGFTADTAPSPYQPGSSYQGGTVVSSAPAYGGYYGSPTVGGYNSAGGTPAQYQVSNPGQGPYTVYNVPVGTGPVVPPSQRIPGERYTPGGQVIA